MAFGTTTAPSAEENRRERPVAGRLVGLARAIDGSRRTSRFDVRQLLLASGATCMGLGVVAIVLGWYGAAHSSYLFQEIPYLISGGLLGVALVAGGGFLFFASWLVRMIEDNHRHTSRLEQTLARVDIALGAGPGAGSVAGPGAGYGAAAAGASGVSDRDGGNGITTRIGGATPQSAPISLPSSPSAPEQVHDPSQWHGARDLGEEARTEYRGGWDAR